MGRRADPLNEDMIRVSIGTAGVLGLARVPMAVAPTTAYLMLGDRCAMNCAFCAQARDSRANESMLSRVSWPLFPFAEVCERLAEAAARGQLRRCCIQVTVGDDVYRRTLRAVRALKSASLPVDVAILADVEQVSELIAAGVDHVGLGLDAACERIFRRVKGGNWGRMLRLIAETARRFPGHLALHLIVGLGETEREMIARIAWAHELGAEVGLFAFTPLPGTPMTDRPPPSLSQYRRVQAARHLIVRCGARLSDLYFDARGRLRGIRVPAWRQLLADGQAFRTSGCPDCNRPFYNERPGGPMYNYPRPLTPQEAQQAIAEMEVEG